MHEEMRREIGKRLQEARKKQRLSQEDVAQRLNVKRQAVSKWECGSTLPLAGEWYVLGQLYGESLDYLVYGVRTIPLSRAPIIGQIFSRPGVEPPSTFGKLEGRPLS